uniref:Uncharacterized protein n=1 Tax=Oryza meridionalis TaxID=40149 RepID=A0A0E0C3D5_9ORYZ
MTQLSIRQQLAPSVGTPDQKGEKGAFHHTHTLRHITAMVQRQGLGRIGYATPTPFAKIPMRYGAKGWGRKCVKVQRRKWGPRSQPSLWTRFAAPTPFATIPMRYGIKGWGRK